MDPALLTTGGWYQTRRLSLRCAWSGGVSLHTETYLKAAQSIDECVHWHNWLSWCIAGSFLRTKRETIKQNTLHRWHHLAGVTSSIFLHILLTNMDSCVDRIFVFSGPSAQSPRLCVIESKTSQSSKLQQSHMECINRGEEHTKGKVNRVSTFPFWVSSLKWNLNLKPVQS